MTKNQKAKSKMQSPLMHFESMLLLLLYATHSTFSCMTPLGYFGKVMPMSECTSIQKLLEQYRNDPPPRLTTFIQMSQRQKINGQDMICCGDAFNLNETDGAAILRNFDNICGDNVHKRISFGTETTLLSYPWSVLLIYNTEQRFHCGGTLVTHRYVLTAAHCVKTAHINLVGVRLGEHNILTDPDCEPDLANIPYCTAPVLDMSIEKVIPHFLYSKFTYDHDIALIRLTQVVVFGRSVRPICLPGFQSEYDRPFGTISGWGATENSTQSNVLIEADVPIFPLSQCQNIYRRSEIDWKHRICAAGSNDIHTCNGDSGGPLSIRLEGSQNNYSRKMRFLQVGVISLGTMSCGESHYNRTLPSVFIKISAFMDWIEQNLEM